MELLPAGRGRWRALSTRLKDNRKGSSPRTTKVELAGDVVIKRYQTSADAAHGAQRLEWLRARVAGVARVPRVLDLDGKELTLERVWGPTVWELQRQHFGGSSEAGIRVRKAIIDAGRLLGRLHRGPADDQEPGTLSHTFQEEMLWVLDGECHTARGDLVSSHTDFAPINLILDVDGTLVVYDPEPNGYVTEAGTVLSRYVDLGVWSSALTMRAPLRQLPAVRRPENGRIFAESLAAYRAEAGVDVKPWFVRAHALAVTSAYLRAMGAPRSIARPTVRLLAPRRDTRWDEAA